jgi:hypothetical protein
MLPTIAPALTVRRVNTTGRLASPRRSMSRWHRHLRDFYPANDTLAVYLSDLPPAVTSGVLAAESMMCGGCIRRSGAGPFYPLATLAEVGHRPLAAPGAGWSRLVAP